MPFKRRRGRYHRSPDRAAVGMPSKAAFRFNRFRSSSDVSSLVAFCFLDLRSNSVSTAATCKGPTAPIEDGGGGAHKPQTQIRNPDPTYLCSFGFRGVGFRVEGLGSRA